MKLTLSWKLFTPLSSVWPPYGFFAIMPSRACTRTAHEPERTRPGASLDRGDYALDAEYMSRNVVPRTLCAGPS